MLKVQYLVYCNLFNPIYTIHTLTTIKGRAPLCLYTPTLRDSEAALLLPHGTSLIVYPFSTGSFQPYSSLDCRGIWDCLLRLRSRQYCPFTEKSKLAM